MSYFYWHQVLSPWREVLEENALSYGPTEINPRQVIDIVLAEHALRELKQRQEALNKRIIALQKAKEVESDDSSDLENFDKQLKETRSRVIMKEYELYQAVSMLNSYFKGCYDDLRLDSKWFMRSQMVRDCSDRSGCCSRACGCCLKRSSHEGKGIGHCTTECWCCTVFRGFELTESQKEEVRNNLKIRIEHKRSAYLTNIADCFFRPLQRPAASTSTSPKNKPWWRRIIARN